MKRNSGFGVEFFADIFASTGTRNISDLEFVAELLPNSYAGFKDVYEHLEVVAQSIFNYSSYRNFQIEIAVASVIKTLLPKTENKIIAIVFIIKALTRLHT